MSTTPQRPSPKTIPPIEPSPPDAVRRGPRSRVALAALALLGLIFFAGFLALGTWQVHRRAWKLDLIARVDQRVHAAPVPAPGPDRWPGINAANDEYRHVSVTGVFLNDRETLVQAVSDLGSGYWVLTPLRQADGAIVLVNRGFVSPERRERPAHGAADATMPASVTGLLRMTEPGGGFLQKNDPANNRWYSRDVQAIAATRGLAPVAPYFIDADATPAAAGTQTWPAAGLTTISFPNNHLVYAITWYGLALMVLGAAWQVRRHEREQRRQARQQPGTGNDGAQETATNGARR